MISKKLLTLFFTSLILLGSLNSPIFGLDKSKLYIYDCDYNEIYPSKTKKLHALAWDVIRAIEEAEKKAKTCLPDGFYDRLMDGYKKNILVIRLACDMDDNQCGQTVQKPERGKNGTIERVGVEIRFNYESIYYEGECGCMEAVALHELMHWGAGVEGDNESEKMLYGCEEKCFECAKDRKGVSAEDCCDNKIKK